MKNRVFWSILLGGLLLVAIGVMLPAPDIERSQFLPWQIEHTPEGATRVFGITLGETSLNEAEKILRSSAEATLFATPEGQYRVEAYFDKVVLGGFSAKMVMVIGVPPDEAEAMFLRGARIATLGSGTNKVTLSSDDARRVFTLPIVGLTYLTRASVDDELLRKRFGEPAERIREPETGSVHWLYPKLGLDVAVDEKGKAVMQYVRPADFARLEKPLHELQVGSVD